MSDKDSIRKIRVALRPMIELFDHKKETLSHRDWTEFIARTKQSVLSNPEQFFGNGVQVSHETSQAIEEIFDQYTEG